MKIIIYALAGVAIAAVFALPVLIAPHMSGEPVSDGAIIAVVIIAFALAALNISRMRRDE